jgi:4-hydroxybenzoate polyprenyltransferase
MQGIQPERPADATPLYCQAEHRPSAVLRALRPHQWTKNLLVFVPLLTSHQFGFAGSTAIAFVCMSLCASGIYVVNDLSDLDADRAHPIKQNRPFASKTLPLSAGLLIAPLLLAAGLSLSLCLPGTATVILFVYVALSLTYTFWLKQKLLADVVVLSLLYALRIVEGGTAASIPLSPWLLAFSLFLLISIAFSKRVTEMLRSAASARADLAGRGYLITDTPTLASLGMASGYLACLVLSLYINNDRIYKLYSHPGWLWLLVPLLLYWIGRFWVLTTRGQMHDDPILFVLNDVVTRFALLCGTILLILAIRGPSGIPGITE